MTQPTQELPAVAETDTPSAPDSTVTISPGRSPRSPLVLSLAGVAALLILVVGALAVLLLRAHATADDAAAAARTKHRQQTAELANAKSAVSNMQRLADDAEAEASASLAAAQQAEAAQSSAEASAAPDAGDVHQFLSALRATDPAFRSVDDDNLVQLGQVTCQYLDTYGDSGPSIAHVIDVGVSSGMTARQSEEVTSAAIVALCPQHTVN